VTTVVDVVVVDVIAGAAARPTVVWSSVDAHTAWGSTAAATTSIATISVLVSPRCISFPPDVAITNRAP
jgi:hypothetical protein